MKCPVCEIEMPLCKDSGSKHEYWCCSRNHGKGGIYHYVRIDKARDAE